MRNEILIRALREIAQEIVAAFSFLTTIPVGWLARRPAPSSASSGASPIPVPEMPPGRIFSFFPLVGLAIGLVLSLIASIRVLPIDVVAFLTLAAWVGLTGGLHLDGLADACDGLFATVTPTRRLEIMKDPRAGAWAVIGVGLILLGKWTALRGLIVQSPTLLLIPPIAGRWAMVLAVAAFPNARTTGLAARFRIGFGRTQIVAASVTAIGLILILSNRQVQNPLLLIAIPLVTVLIVGRWAAARLGGGLTGDVYGLLCELVELLCLIALSGQ